MLLFVNIFYDCYCAEALVYMITMKAFLLYFHTFRIVNHVCFVFLINRGVPLLLQA